MIMLARPLVIMQVRRKIRFFKIFSMKFLYFFIPKCFSFLLIPLKIFFFLHSFLPSFLPSFLLSYILSFILHPFFLSYILSSFFLSYILSSFFLSYILSSFFFSYFRSISFLTSFQAIYINILMKSKFYKISAYKSPERFSQLSTIFKFFFLKVVSCP